MGTIKALLVGVCEWLLTNAIKQYELELEELKIADKLI